MFFVKHYKSTLFPVKTSRMPQFLGEYECKIDAKGRMRMPTPLIKQLDGLEKEGFVMNRGFEKCLVLYPKSEWTKITEELNGLNQYEPENRDFIRKFFRGATEMTLDSTDRILITKRLKEYAHIDKEAVVFAYLNKIEIWSNEEYDNYLENSSNSMSSLASKVMGKKEI